VIRLHVQHPSQRGDAVNQTARTVLIGRILLNDLCLNTQKNVLHLLIGDLSSSHPPLGMHCVPVLGASYNCSNSL
jgi:hypothetical protein